MRKRRRPRFARRFARRRNARSGGFLGIELKFYDKGLANAALTAPTDASGGEHNPSATIALNTVTQGDGESQRDGRKIRMRSITIDGDIHIGAQGSQSAADAGIQCFIALVMDTQTNGALLNSEDVFVNPVANASTAAFPFRNLQFMKRFKVLAKRSFTLDRPQLANDTGATGGVIQGGILKKFHIAVRLNHNVIYNGTTETIANITDNSLTMIAYVTSTSMTPSLSYNSRLRFVG